MLFINISSDKVQVADAQQDLGSEHAKETFLDRNGIEATLGKTLIEWYKKTPFDEILLLNGPGGFTNLRVGTLIINLLNKLLNFQHQKEMKIYSITKFDLFSHLFKKGFLPRDGVVYIGQRDNVRCYDAEEKTHTQTKLDTLEKNTNLFFDFVKEEYRGEFTPQMLSFQMTEKGLEILRKGKKTSVTVSDLALQAQSQVKPEYMIEAVVQ